MVAQEEMQIVKRIFCMVGVEGHTMRAVKHAFEREGTLAPKGGRHWNPTFLHKVILDDVCKPHTYEEVKALVTPEVAAKLRPGERYGVWWYNRTRTLESYVTEVGPNGKRYKRRRSSTEKPPSEWIVIPVPDSGIPREWVDAAREAIKENRKHPSSNRRFWELSGGILRCGCCGYVMRQDARVKSTGSWFYYGCSRRWNRGKDTCPNAKSFDVNRVEPLVWRFVSELLQAPEQLREDLERMIEQECRNLREDPDREVEVWLKKMTEVAQMRDNYQEMVARGLITFGELEEKLGQLEEGRATAERELAALEGVGSA